VLLNAAGLSSSLFGTVISLVADDVERLCRLREAPDLRH
jgi:hypothetical protein